MLVKTVTYNDADCLEYDIIINEERVAYAVEYKDNSAEIYYNFEDDDPRSSYVFDSIEELNDFIYNQFSAWLLRQLVYNGNMKN